MSLLAGTITINAGAGTFTGTGLALGLMQAKDAAWTAGVAAVTSAGGAAPSIAAKVAVYTLYKAEVEAMASAIVTYFTANASIAIPVPAGSIQVAPALPVALVNLTGGTLS